LFRSPRAAVAHVAAGARRALARRMAPRPRADCGRRALASLGDGARRQQTLLALRAVHTGGTPRRRGRAADRRPAWLQAACAELRLRLRLDALRRPCRGTAALLRAAPDRDCLPMLALGLS